MLLNWGTHTFSGILPVIFFIIMSCVYSNFCYFNIIPFNLWIIYSYAFVISRFGNIIFFTAILLLCRLTAICLVSEDFYKLLHLVECNGGRYYWDQLLFKMLFYYWHSLVYKILYNRSSPQLLSVSCFVLFCWNYRRKTKSIDMKRNVGFNGFKNCKISLLNF